MELESEELDAGGDRHLVGGFVMGIDARAGTLPAPSMLVDVPRLVSAFYVQRPDPSIAEQRVMFGTSGHRGSSFESKFNEWHILAITQAICDYRHSQHIDGPLFIGKDTHALSEPAFSSALEVLAANQVEAFLSDGEEYTPTPAISHAVLVYNRRRASGFADGIVVTPSHNPPEDGGFKYDPPSGGPADLATTNWIQARANAHLENHLRGVKRVLLAQALQSPTTHKHNFADAYVDDLSAVLDMEIIHRAGLKLGVDPMGGAGVHYWPRIAERYQLNLTVLNDQIDPTFRFVPLDWDGRIRMDPSSPYTMTPLVALKDRFDLAFACDTDHDRHGIVTASSGLMPANHFLAVCIDYLFPHRPRWSGPQRVGKTIVSSSMIDRVAEKRGKTLYEVPVGFKWFVQGLLDGSLGFAGEESAGASLLRRDGSVWTTDKDAIVPALLSAEITAKLGRDPGEVYRALAQELGDPAYERIAAPATSEEKALLDRFSPKCVTVSELAGEPIEKILTTAPGNGQAIGGLKVIAKGGWFAARASGTEEMVKIYAESFRGKQHLVEIEEEARKILRSALTAAGHAAS